MLSIRQTYKVGLSTQTAGPKSVRSANGRPLIALRCLLLMLISRLRHFEL